MVYTYYHGPKRTGKAKELRRNQTPAEKILWERLIRKRLSGFKFRRQHVLFDYIVDFYCAKLKFIIEIDGKYHQTRTVEDLNKDKTLQQAGFTVVRFTNAEVKCNLERVMQVMIEKVDDLEISVK